MRKREREWGGKVRMRAEVLWLGIGTWLVPKMNSALSLRPKPSYRH